MDAGPVVRDRTGDLPYNSAMPTSKSQIDKLGDRLRHSTKISEEDLAGYQKIREEYAPALKHVQQELRGIGLESTGRLKTLGTVVDKLRREGTRLSTIQDIAGTRIVVDGGLTNQDDVVDAISRAFPDHRVHDRRQSPSHGYRAVHVVVVVDQKSVEVQVRTTLQDLWAQIFEGLADRWGRGIRYGEPVPHADQPIDGETPFTRQDLVELLQKSSRTIAGVEELRTDLVGPLETSGLGLRRPGLRIAAFLLNRRIRRSDRRVRGMETEMRDLMTELLDAIESEPL